MRRLNTLCLTNNGVPSFIQLANVRVFVDQVRPMAHYVKVIDYLDRFVVLKWSATSRHYFPLALDEIVPAQATVLIVTEAPDAFKIYHRDEMLGACNANLVEPAV